MLSSPVASTMRRSNDSMLAGPPNTASWSAMACLMNECPTRLRTSVLPCSVIFPATALPAMTL
ncbi:hypothetical protein EV645_6498 [Kribbella rubisoli]|uniref:Uncharacterized protein n=1 Tax=Kribbella rubisoli TaxID=3075929 RepID=A0A4Q7WMI9_9ACTN|nr:hypothetical protein EV645_6498 [Kribbella rubisoli]